MAVNVEQLWQQLVAAAVLGTERRPAGAVWPQLRAWLEAAGPGAAGAGVEPDPAEESSSAAADPEADLLRAAAAASLYRRVGRLPAREAGPRPAVCEPDDRPRCSPAAAQRLSVLLAGTNAELLPEWLEAAGRAGLRLPETQLHSLLALGRDDPDLAEAIPPVLGKRGAWLAAQNPDWAYAVPVEAATAWETGKRAIRRQTLKRLRLADPPAARQLLASTWEQEAAEDRAAFLAILTLRLSLEDEPFLEAALDDRSREVRRTAADLLARLDGSRMVERYTRWALPCLSVDARLRAVRRPRLVVNLPEACTPEMARSGVDPRPRSGMGERASWLLQLVSVVPPRRWCEASGRQPAELVELARQGEWADILKEAWITATLRHADADWARALLEFYPGRAQLLDAIPEGERDQLAAAMVRDRRVQEGMWMASQYQHPWGPDLTRAVIEWLGEAAESFNGDYRESDFDFLRSLGLYMDPQLSDEAARSLRQAAAPGSAYEWALYGLFDLLEFRRELLRELGALPERSEHERTSA